MKSPYLNKQEIFQQIANGRITPEEGVQLLNDLQSYTQSKPLEIPPITPENKSPHNRISNEIQDETGKPNSLIEKTRQELLKITSAIVKMDVNTLELDKNMQEYGFDSSALVTFSKKLNATYSLQTTPALFFELTYPSLEVLAQYLISHYRPELENYYHETTQEPQRSEIQSPAPEKSGTENQSSVQKPFKSNHTTDDPIAIIGMSGVMPQSDNLEIFWEHLEKEDDLIGEVPKDRWDWKAFAGNSRSAAWGGFMTEIDKFDAEFFGISPREAGLMDPQQRIFLEIVWKTIEDAGYKPSDLAGTKTGIFVGISSSDYQEVLLDASIPRDTHAATGTSHSMLPNRISFLLNLHGPSEPVDTACSSSLTAVHRGIEAIRSGTCQTAIVGGINVIIGPSGFIALSAGGVLAGDGRCKTFDRDADGFVRSEGGGAVFLKPLSQAQNDGDHIYAVIKGSAVNHGGRAHSLTAPNANAQAALIIEAFENAGITPDTVNYIEAHGTGTNLGDPVEINGLKKAYHELYTKKGKQLPQKPICALSSVKTNIGHLEAAAGISGILKILLALKYKKIPANIHLKNLNPYLELDGSPFYVIDKTIPWEQLQDEDRKPIPRRAGISSFGFGGSNAHVLLEEWTGEEIEKPIKNQNTLIQADTNKEQPYLFVLSAKNQEQLEIYVKDMITFLEKKTPASPSPTDEVKEPIEIDLYIREVLSEILNVRPTDLPHDENLENCGMDQVGLSRLAQRLQEKYHKEITIETLIKYPTLRELSRFINGKPPTLSNPKAQEETGTSLPEIIYTLQVGREPFEARMAIITVSLSQLLEKLNQYAKKESPNKANTEGIYTGNSQAHKQEVTQSQIKNALVNQNLEQLAQLFVAGNDIDWRQLYPGQKPKRISIPTYPFARKRHWVFNRAVTGDNQPTQQKESIMNQQNDALKNSKIQLVIKNTPKVEPPNGIELIKEPDKKKITLKNHSTTPDSSYTPHSLSPQPVEQKKPEEKLTIAVTNAPDKASVIPKIKEILARVLFMDLEKIDEAKPFIELGLDSILAVEFTKKLQETYPIELKATKLYDYSTVIKLAEYLVTLIPTEESNPQAMKSSTPREIEIESPGNPGKLPEQHPKLIQKEVHLQPIQETYTNTNDKASLIPSVKKLLAEVLFMESNGLDENKPFIEMGLDSILAVEFTKKVNEAFQMDLKATKLYDYSTIKTLAQYLTTQGAQVKNHTGQKETGEIPHKINPTPPTPSIQMNPPQSLKTAPLTPDTLPSTHRKFMDIAIIGISGRYPGADNLSDYWENLANGVDSVTEIPKDRWDTAQFYDPNPNAPDKTYCKWGGFLKDIDKFDPLFFNISPAEAETLDPHQRLFMEEAWKALEDAGYSAESLDKKRCGVYAGIMSDGEYPSYSMFNVRSILASRISYFLNLKGPVLSLDTACSSALVAMHLASQSLIEGETDMMLAGGVTLYLTEIPYLRMSRMGGILSPEGKCKTFDNSADGFVPAEGVGVVVLKLLEKAIKDGDHIYGVIKGSAMNHDGRTNGITAPSGESQRDLELEVYKKFAINPATISYVEAHGTGTKLGDPIELEALTEAFRQYTQEKQFCPIGSVKSNLGHTSAAAGTASVIKVLLSIKNKQIPPSLHFHNSNEHIDFKNSPFYVNTQLKEWKPSNNTPRRAAISSFGFSGTNVHMIIEEPPEITHHQKPTATPYYFIPISARSEAILKNKWNQLNQLLQHNENHLRLGDIAYTLGMGRSHYSYRSTLIVRDLHQLKSGLTMIQKGETPGFFNMQKVNRAAITVEEDKAIKENGKRLLQELQPVNIPLMSDSEYKNRIQALADLYLKGYDPEWNMIYNGMQYKRISLPTYPFARERHWAVETNLPVKPASGKLGLPSIDNLNEESIKTYIQADLIRFLHQLLKVKEDDIDIDMEMFQYGFDSILFLEYMKQINTTYAIEFTVESFFDLGNPTIRSLTETLYSLHNEKITEYFRQKKGIKQLETPISTPQETVTQEKVQSYTHSQTACEPVAVIGISAQMPSCNDMEQFWDNLEKGNSLITEITVEGHKKRSGNVTTENTFDAGFFGISAQEAQNMSPQQRILLELTWKAIEDAGYKASDLWESRTGVFIGHSNFTNPDQTNSIGATDKPTQTFWENQTTAMTANGISYHFNLRGPSEIIDTGRSSSLAAVHRAVEALHNGVCKIALAGGVNLNPGTDAIGENKNAKPSQLLGEGAVIIVLKPLSQAKTSGDNIYAVIKGTAENHAGRLGKFGAPDAKVLSELFTSALSKSQIAPETITYYESNGNPFKPDPLNSTEIEGYQLAIKEYYNQIGHPQPQPKQIQCAFGTLAPITGHLQSATGIAGLLKVLLSLKHKKLPVTIDAVNTEARMANTKFPFYPASKTQPWESQRDDKNRKIPRRAAITSLSPGGTNVHIIVEEGEAGQPIQSIQEPVTGNTTQLIPLSARNLAELKVYAQKLNDHLAKLTPPSNPAQTGDELTITKEELRQKFEDDIVQISNETIKINPEGYDPGSVRKFITQINETFHLEIDPEVFNTQPSIGAFIKYLRKHHKEKLNLHYNPDNKKSGHTLNLAEIAYTLQTGREEMDERLALTVSGINELKEKLEKFCQGKTVIQNGNHGNIKKSQQQLILLMEGEEKDEFINRIIKDKKFNKLAYCWSIGIQINWNMLYPEHHPNRISLPTYPFNVSKAPVKTSKQQKKTNSKKN